MQLTVSDPTEPAETAWTIRLPRALLERLDARVQELNSARKGRGPKWSRNGLAVEVLSEAADAWEASGAGTGSAPPDPSAAR